MSATESTILWLVLWWAVMLVQLPAIRMIASRATGSMKFDPNGADLQGYGQRATRAYNNCVENIPLFIGVLLFAMFSGQSEITNATACWLLYARMGQSVAHLVSVSTTWIMIRFAFYLVQVGLIVCWVVQMLMA